MFLLFCLSLTFNSSQGTSGDSTAHGNSFGRAISSGSTNTFGAFFPDPTRSYGPELSSQESPNTDEGQFGRVG